MKRRSLIFAWLGLILAAAHAAAQDSQPATTQATASAPTQPAGETLIVNELSLDALNTRIQQLEAQTDLPEAVRREALAQLQQARDQVQIASDWQTKLDEYERRIREAPADLEALKAQPPLATQPAATQATLDELTAQLAEAEARLRVEQDQLRLLDQEAESREQRRRALPELITAAVKQREAAALELGTDAPAGTTPQVDQARRTLLQARARAVELEVSAYQRELAAYSARSEILTIRRDQARLNTRAIQERVTALQAAITLQREQEVARQRAQIEEELQRAPQAVRDVAERNAELARLRDELTPRIASSRDRVRVLTEAQERVNEALKRAKADTELVGVSAYVGQRLRQTMAGLDAWRDLPTQIKRTRRELDEVAALEWQVEQEREDLPPLEEAVRQVTAGGLDERLSPAARQRLRTVFTSQRELLERVKLDYEELATQLRALLAALGALQGRVEELANFVAEKVLWVRSSEPIYHARPPADVTRQISLLPGVLRGLANGFLARPTPDLASATALLALIALRRRMRDKVVELAQRVSSAYTDRYRDTLSAVGLTALLAIPIPLLLWHLGRRLQESAAGDESDVLAAALGAGCARAALVMLFYSLVQQVCRPRGLGEAHFRWDRGDLAIVRREIAWLKWVTAPIVILTVTLDALTDEGWRDLIARLLYTAGLVALTLFSHRLLHPERGLTAGRPARSRTSLFERSRTFWYVLGLGAPPVLLLLSLAGYHYTSTVMLRMIIRTIWLLLGLTLLQALLIRWLFVAQRRIALEQARRKAAEAQQQAEASGSGADDRPPIDEEKLNLVSLGDQTRQLLRSAVTAAFVIGAWLIWRDVLPALAVLDAVSIGSYPVDTTQTAPDGATRVVSTLQHVTLTHVALATLISFLTFVLAKNIPALIEIILLQKLPIDAAGRYAVTTIARYAITAIGVTVAFGAVGVRWSQVQWLVAAISVGLGFGLQEIFANFVSGLMLLFERQVRIGDTVTVGNVTGVVTRIRIRATTITDWDRKDLIIPNREFVTGQVINWTLTDTTLRLVIPVGVAYGSDTRRVEAELLRVARNSRLTLSEPPPRVVFTGFGDSALNFELRVFLHIDDSIDTRNELVRGIDDAFRAAGIEIAFPQREVRIVSESPTVPPPPVPPPPGPARPA